MKTREQMKNLHRLWAAQVFGLLLIVLAAAVLAGQLVAAYLLPIIDPITKVLR